MAVRASRLRWFVYYTGAVCVGLAAAALQMRGAGPADYPDAILDVSGTGPVMAANPGDAAARANLSATSAQADAGSKTRPHSTPEDTPEDVAQDTPQDMPSRFDLDVPRQQTTFGQAEIQALLQAGAATVYLPDGQLLHLHTSHTRDLAGDGHVITAAAAGLVSTITTRGNLFFATLATPRGVYRLQNLPHSNTQASVTAHRALDQRTMQTPRDFAHAPVPGAPEHKQEHN